MALFRPRHGIPQCPQCSLAHPHQLLQRGCQTQDSMNPIRNRVPESESPGLRDLCAPEFGTARLNSSNVCCELAPQPTSAYVPSKEHQAWNLACATSAVLNALNRTWLQNPTGTLSPKPNAVIMGIYHTQPIKFSLEGGHKPPSED